MYLFFTSVIHWLARFQSLTQAGEVRIQIAKADSFCACLTAGSSPPTAKGEKVAAALTVGCLVAAHGLNTLEFCLAWDMPKVTFGSREKEHVRYMWCVCICFNRQKRFMQKRTTQWNLKYTAVRG